MKKLLYSSLLLLCAIPVKAASLMPPNHYVCETFQAERKVMMSCAEGRQFYTDQDGRCGCLREEEMTPPEVCLNGCVECNEIEGFTYSSLYQDLNRCGPTQNVLVGCGCFATE